MSTPTEEQINHLQSLLDAGTPGLHEWITGENLTILWKDIDLIRELRNLAPALLEAARENLRLREALEHFVSVAETAPPIQFIQRLGESVTVAKAALRKEGA